MLVPVKPRRRDRDNGNERGSVLIIIAVILVFVGFMLTLGLGSFKTQDAQDRIEITAHRQKLLIDELAAYTQRENRIPCPADPSIAQTGFTFGFARGSNPTADPNGAGTCPPALAEGIVPFRTLGLEPYDAIDGWGHFMTYRVSPVSANPFASTSITGATIYMRCRRFPWFDDGTLVYTGGGYYNRFNAYAEKAAFCCPPKDTYGKASDLQVFSSAANLAAGTTINGIGRVADSDVSDNTGYGNINTMVVGSSTDYGQIPLTDVNKQEIFAFAIISHGANGVGAFNVDGTLNKVGGTAGADEQVNFNAPLTQVMDHAMVLTPGANYYDDMVVWRTQIGLMGELSNASCYTPWR